MVPETRGLQKQPSHPLCKDIKTEYIHVCKLTNANNSLVKPQEGKVLVLQLLQRPCWRAGGVSQSRETESRNSRRQSRETKAPSTIIIPNVTPLYGDWWYIINMSADNEMSNVAKSWAVRGFLLWWNTGGSLVNTNTSVPGMILTGGRGR